MEEPPSSSREVLFLPELPLDVLEKSVFDEESGPVREFVEHLNNFLWCPLSSPDATNQHADCSVDFDSHLLRYEARSGVIREEHGALPGREKSQAGALARMKGEGLAQSGQLRIGRLSLGHQGREILRERVRAMLEYLLPDFIRHE